MQCRSRTNAKHDVCDCVVQGVWTKALVQHAVLQSQCQTHRCTTTSVLSLVCVRVGVEALAMHLLNRLRRRRLNFGPLASRLSVLGCLVVDLCKRTQGIPVYRVHGKQSELHTGTW